MENLFNEKNIYLDVEGETFEEILKNIEPKLKEQNLIFDNYVDEVLKREREFPTGLELDGYNLAIPHADSCYVKSDLIAVIKPKNEVVFNDMATNTKDLKVKLIFLLLIKESKNQVKVLSSLMKKFADKTFYNNVIDEKNTKLLLDILGG